HGYHHVTSGWLIGEVVRRVTGRTLGRFFAEEIAGPLGLDLWIGLPPEEQARVAPLTNRGLQDAPARPYEADDEEEDDTSLYIERVEKLLGPNSLLIRTLGGVSGSFLGYSVFNQPKVRAAEVPALNAVGDARSLARL